MKEVFTYDDLLLVPQYSDIRSREEVNIETDLDDRIHLTIPIIASPMDTVSEEDTAVTIGKAGGVAVIHRYNSIEEQTGIIASVIASEEDCLIGAAIGVTGDYLERALALYAAEVDFICLDVAHGHSILMKEALETLRKRLPEDLHIMAGNVATVEGFNDLADWGANSIRCNIGGGCFTPGTLVRGPNGDTPIEQVKIGDKVFSHTGEIRKVVDTLTFNRDEELIVINGVESTKNHEYYVVNIQDANKVNNDNLDSYAYWLEAEKIDMNKHLLVELQ